MTAKSERLHIDWTRYDGRGLCVELLPGLLSRDDWAYPTPVTTHRRRSGAKPSRNRNQPGPKAFTRYSYSPTNTRGPLPTGTRSASADRARGDAADELGMSRAATTCGKVMYFGIACPVCSDTDGPLVGSPGHDGSRGNTDVSRSFAEQRSAFDVWLFP
jgi:hypothetical protein